MDSISLMARCTELYDAFLGFEVLRSAPQQPPTCFFWPHLWAVVGVRSTSHRGRAALLYRGRRANLPPCDMPVLCSQPLRNTKAAHVEAAQGSPTCRILLVCLGLRGCSMLFCVLVCAFGFDAGQPGFLDPACQRCVLFIQG